MERHGRQKRCTMHWAVPYAESLMFAGFITIGSVRLQYIKIFLIGT